MQPDTEKNKIKSNINKNYLFLGLTTLDFTRGLWMIYLLTRGFSLTELGILEGTFHLTSFLMEIPTGIIADLKGRKFSRNLGRIFYLSSLAIMFWSRSFLFQLIGFAVTAVGYNLESGAGEAMLYDSMKQTGIEGQYKKTAGYNNLIFETGGTISFLAGGYLAAFRGYTWVFIPSMAFCVLSILIGQSFREPDLIQHEQKRLKSMGWLRAMWAQTMESFRVVKEKPRIAFMIIFSEMIFMFLTSLFFYLQTYWKNTGWNEFSIGAVLAATGTLSALTGLMGGEIEKRTGPDGILIFAPFFLILCLWGIVLTEIPAFFYIITGIINGLLYVAVQDYLNKMIPSERRATVLSFQSMTFSLFMIVFFPLIGLIGDRQGLKTSFAALAVTGTVLFVFYLIITASVRKNAERKN